ncbi:9657_t:CDS:2, partial [Gigaspora rosea]
NKPETNVEKADEILDISYDMAYDVIMKIVGCEINTVATDLMKDKFNGRSLIPILEVSCGQSIEADKYVKDIEGSNATLSVDVERISSGEFVVDDIEINDEIETLLAW